MLSNIRQLGTAFQLYLTDYDEQLPSAVHGTNGVGRTGGWLYFTHYPANDPSFTGKAFDVTKGSLYSYIKNAQIFTCPSDSQGGDTGDSYAANSCVFMPTAEEGVVTGKALAEFAASSDWLLLTEEAFSSLAGSSDGSFLRTQSTDDGFLYYGANLISTRHSLGANAVFLDGHAKWFRAEQIVSGHYQTGGQDLSSCP